ncbi:MAG: hypothetical protein ACT4PJ_02655 [Gemmatimonadaceae bacterium]
MPAIGWHADEIERELAQGHPFDTRPAIENERFAKLSPPARRTNIDQCAKARVTQIQHILRRG